MKQRLADYVADFLVARGITDCFTVVGGGAMHLNDALGHKEGIHCTYNHHEQACAMAAEAYARVENRMAGVCVTTGPGGTNAITGVLGGWLDSIPMFVISGQVRYDTTARYMERFTDGKALRAVGDQEFDITKSVASMCKYAAMVENPMDIRYMMEKAYYLAMHGRRGPVWIDIPVNFQGAYIQTEQLRGYDPAEDMYDMPLPVSGEIAMEVLHKIQQAKRPVLYAGNGIRLSGGYETFCRVVRKLNIPVVTCWDSIDAIYDTHPLYIGRGGIMGDRAGNFAVQNADLVLAIGNRLSIRQVGYNWRSWAREAYVIMVDINPAELKKKTIHVEFPICADARDFLCCLETCMEREQTPILGKDEWLRRCQEWKKQYPVTLPKHWSEDDGAANVYAFIQYLSSRLPEGNMTVVSNGSACVVGSHNYVIKKNARFLINSGVASMGYGLPAAIGACVGSGRKMTICIEGDGSIMMNLQELQTIQTNGLPIKIFVINNQGYHSIRQTQDNLFGDRKKVGIGPESGDLSFPDFKKLAEAFGYPYFCAHSSAEMKEMVDHALCDETAVFCEVFVSVSQKFEPKSATRRLENGTLESPPLEDLAPFLSREELADNMEIPMWKENETEQQEEGKK